MSRPSPARRVAARVLHRIAREDAWAAPALDAEIEKARLDERDAALATEIVYGVLRALPSIDRRIEAHRSKPGPIEPFVQAVLRAATHQLLHLRTPPHAVVSDSVTMAREQRGEGLARFANALLRRIAAERPASPERPSATEVPEWLAVELERGLSSSSGARAFLEARPTPPPIALRVGTTRISREELASRIRAALPRASVELGALSPSCLLLRRAGDPRSLPGYREGLFAVQDEGSQIIAMLSGAADGERVADACAGRGGKTAILAEQVGTRGEVVAIDLHEWKLEQIRPELERLGLGDRSVRTEAIDLSVGTGGLDGLFDRVLVDAPCTGLGTIHRRPEILLRARAEDPARMSELQLAIAKNASRLLKPGGTMLYAVCSPTAAEGPSVRDRLLAEVPDLETCEVVSAPPTNVSLRADSDGVLRLGASPEIDPAIAPDLYQVMRLRRRH